MKKLFRNSTHTNVVSHDCLICEIKGKKVKMTYEAYNAQEKCIVEFFDGDKWNYILGMLDMGVEPEKSAYNIWNSSKRNERANDLFKKAELMCKGIL